MDKTLKHHGILGMRWGIRRTPKQLGNNSKRSKKSSNNSNLGKIGKFFKKMKQTNARVKDIKKHSEQHSKGKTYSKVAKFIADAGKTMFLTSAVFKIAREVAPFINFGNSVTPVPALPFPYIDSHFV